MYDVVPFTSLSKDYITHHTSSSKETYAIYTDLIIRVTDHVDFITPCVNISIKYTHDDKFRTKTIFKDSTFTGQMLHYANGYMIILFDGIAYSENGNTWDVIKYCEILDYDTLTKPTKYAEPIHFWSICHVQSRQEKVNYSLKEVNELMLLSYKFDNQAIEILKQKYDELNKVKDEIRKKQQLRQTLEQDLLKYMRTSSNKLKSEINDMQQLQHELEREYEDLKKT